MDDTAAKLEALTEKLEKLESDLEALRERVSSLEHDGRGTPEWMR